MQSLFSLDAQRPGSERSVSAEADGFGVTVYTSDGPVRVPGVKQAVRVARDDIGRFLKDAKRTDWGLRVTVAGVQAVYGDWPLIQAPVPDSRPEPSLVVRIRSRWDGGGPLSALENAIEIIRAYLSRDGRKAA
jgi:hypothetical protein